MKIYLIVANNGDYDYSEWPVIACKQEDEAKKIMRECREYVNELKEKLDNSSVDKKLKMIRQYQQKAKWDKEMDRWTGYNIMEIELI